jgi:hypothetical protein
LGGSDPGFRVDPGMVAGEMRFTTIATGLGGAGGTHTCALTHDGAAYCWGANAFGQLGDGTAADRPTPNAVATALRFSAIAAGGEHSCALTQAGEAYCWGLNRSGQLGDSGTTHARAPVRVAGGLTFRAIGAGRDRTCALTTDGALYCWGGDHPPGTLGGPATETCAGPQRGEFLNCMLVPTPVLPDRRFRALAVGTLHACALDTGGAAYCWSGLPGPFLAHGEGAAAAAASGSAIPGEGGREARFQAVGAGHAHSCGVTANGGMLCWGAGRRGQLGDGTGTTHWSPVRVGGP